jgi:hypothetical protein
MRCRKRTDAAVAVRRAPLAFAAVATRTETSMHDPHTPAPAGRHVPFKQEGWGIALFVCLLAVGSALTAFYVHKRTYLPPTDVRAHAVGDRASH